MSCLHVLFICRVNTREIKLVTQLYSSAEEHYHHEFVNLACKLANSVTKQITSKEVSCPAEACEEIALKGCRGRDSKLTFTRDRELKTITSIESPWKFNLFKSQHMSPRRCAASWANIQFL